MWKAFAPLLILVVATVAPLTSAGEGKYSTKYDNVDLDEILNNDRLFNNYMDCLLDDGDERCTPEGKDLKVFIPDALQTDCAKCNDKQKARVDKVIKFIRDNKKDGLEKLKAKYDPDGTYFEHYERHLKEHA
ncbi:ejaculatory bulb-specific protein 3-like isoform X2 [Schistocerca nitens]|uniref:ejaculatory bulb-specific protein 3-like isoform X2 n=1 Tax=Schistocerca nitens TaxID=7011 RepID=UPI0021196B27|nr:ejaculatory bulb-specific protein 3-like isoform X2 [Schistocerca nitens]